ncbi:MAG: glycosyltransferase family 4 protein [Nitrosomonas sp. PRO4]|nr:glycosyltransferase family 4 protein [Nitrosomonas sp. PRO4]
MFLDFPISMVAAPSLSFTITFFSILWLIKSNPNWMLDHPNSRSLHTIPIPRIGGLGLFLGVIAAWLLFSMVIPVSIWIGVSLLILVSLADDIWHAPIWCRLLIQGIAAIGFSLAHVFHDYGWVITLGAVITVIWIANAYNFMDGSDGLAGGMAVIGFGYYGCFAYLTGHYDFAIVNFTIASAALAFLIHNFYPARIFLGDSGSIPLGFLAAGLGIVGWRENIWSVWLPILIFSPFLADSSVTLFKRLIRGEKVWQAHREHYYQRIIQRGFGHRNMALSGFALMIAAGGSAVWAGQHDLKVQYWVVAIWAGIYLTVMHIFDCSQKHYSGRR